MTSTAPGSSTSTPADLTRLLSPDSIVFVGASADAGKISGRPLRFLKEKGWTGRLAGVNPRYDELAGVPCFPRVTDVPWPVDLAIVTLPAAHTLAALEDCAAKGVPFAVVFTAGYAETGEAGARLQAEIQELCRRTGLRICGPNCMGIVNAAERMMGSFSPRCVEVHDHIDPVAFVTQSGAFGRAIYSIGRDLGLQMRYFISSGNEVDLEFADYALHAVRDPNVAVIGGYLEGARDGAKLIAAADQALAAGKPLVVLKVGRTGAAARAAASHTASLTGSDDVYEALFRQKGIIRVDDEIQLLDALSALSLRAGRHRRAGGVAVISSSGGAGVLMSDLLETRGLQLATLSPETRSGLEAIIPAFGSAANPVDLTAQMIGTKDILERCYDLILNDDAVDTMAVLWGGSFAVMPNAIENLKQAAAATEKLIVVSPIGAMPGVADQLRAGGIPVYESLARCAEAVSVLDRYAQALDYRDQVRAAARPRSPSRLDQALTLIESTLGPDDRTLSETLAKQVLSLYGVPITRQKLATTAEEAAAAAQEIGFPVVLKIESPDILHKTEAGGVALNLTDPPAVEAAFATLIGNAGRHTPPARIHGVQVQEMVPAGVEMLIGLSRDPVVGPVITVGLGGIFVEVLRDVARGLPPLTSVDAEAMLDSLRAAGLLAGVRGAAPSDRAAVVATLLAVSDLALDLADLIEEMDINPLIVGPAGSGAKAADGLILLREDWRERAVRPKEGSADRQVV